MQVLKRHKILHLHNLFCKNKLTGVLCHQHAGSSHCLDLLLSPSAEEFSLDDDRLLGKFAFAKNFVVTLQSNNVQITPKTVKILSIVKKPKDYTKYRKLQVHAIPDHQTFVWTLLEPPERARWWCASTIKSEGIYKAKSLNLNGNKHWISKTFSCVHTGRYKHPV